MSKPRPEMSARSGEKASRPAWICAGRRLQNSWSFEIAGENFLITRQTLPAIKKTVLTDFQNILRSSGLDVLFHFHKTEMHFTNTQTGTKIHFVQSDDEEKVKGASYYYVWLEEANSIKFEVFRQYLFRLRPNGKAIISFNPSDSNTWINKEVEQKRDDFALIKSSYLDNPYLSPDQIKEIELLKTQDPNYWQIYGRGEYGVIRNKVFDNYETIKGEVFDAILAPSYYGLDVGFSNSKTALIEVKEFRGAYYLKELIFETGLQTYELNKKCLSLGINGLIIIDSQASSTREELRKAGFMVKNANKNKARIDRTRFVAGQRLFIEESSTNLLKELEVYKFKEDKNGEPTNEPVKAFDDAIDAMAYARYSQRKNVNLWFKSVNSTERIMGLGMGYFS